MAKTFSPLKEIPRAAGFKKGDVIVLFGELFGKGYANGIVEYAKEKGLKLVGTTVGRRESDGTLRPLTSEELAIAKSLAPFDHFINIPLEAGFDLEKAKGELSPCDQLQGVKMDQWDQVKLDWQKIEISQHQGRTRFKTSTAQVAEELKKWISKDANILFVHTMAGGIPRAKILMPTMNKVFKGRGDRFIGSQKFWESEMGRLCTLTFREVTAETYRHLIDETASLREGRHVSYVAYGYHGCEILMDAKYTWQSYSPYLQGWAKIDLETISEEKWSQGIKSTVFNCPEILTNSSNLFQGVELPLYPFLGALKKERPQSPATQEAWAKCKDLLKPEFSVESVLKYSNEVMTSQFWGGWCDYKTWPQHSGAEQMESMLNASDKLIDMHKDPKSTLALDLSKLIFKSTGHLMFEEGYWSTKPVWWLGHDILAKVL